MATAKRKPGRPRTALGTPGTGVNVKLGTKLFEAVRYASDETGYTGRHRPGCPKRVGDETQATVNA